MFAEPEPDLNELNELKLNALDTVNPTISKNRERTCRSLLLIGTLVAAVMGFVSGASAATISFGLDIEFSGATAPVSATTPWVTIVLDDSFGNANTVRMTVSAPNLTGGDGGESINKFLLNFDPSLDASLLNFSVVDNSASVPNAIKAENNGFRADGDGFFDIEFDMPPPPGNVTRFTGGETIIYDLIYVSPISASSFDFFSVMGGGAGVFSAAAQIQRINGESDESGWIGPIPEPSTAVLLALGMMGLGWRRQVR